MAQAIEESVGNVRKGLRAESRRCKGIRHCTTYLLLFEQFVIIRTKRSRVSTLPYKYYFYYVITCIIIIVDVIARHHLHHHHHRHQDHHHTMLVVVVIIAVVFVVAPLTRSYR